MIEIARDLLTNKQNIDSNDIRLGFHWPPLNSIRHVHLHAIAPVSQMSLFSKLIFMPNTFWFASVSLLVMITILNRRDQI